MIELIRIKICLAVGLFEELKKCQAEPLWKSDQMLLLRTVAVANNLYKELVLTCIEFRQFSLTLANLFLAF